MQPLAGAKLKGTVVRQVPLQSNYSKIPAPGTALTAHLRKYRVELHPYRNHDHGQALLAAILLLLNQAEQ